jgi:hypothetical protein
MLKSVWCTYNINEPICQWSLFVLSLGAAWLPRHTPGTSLTLGRTARRGNNQRGYVGQNDPIMVVDKSAAMAVNSYARLGSLSS